MLSPAVHRLKEFLVPTCHQAEAWVGHGRQSCRRSFWISDYGMVTSKVDPLKKQSQQY